MEIKNMNFDEFRKMVSEKLGIDQARLHKKVKLIDTLGIDSLTLINFIISLEKKFNIKIPMDKIYSLKTLEEYYLFFQTVTLSEKRS